MRCTVAAVGLLLAVTPSAGWAQTVYRMSSTSVAGRPCPDKIKGQLTIDDTTIGFARKDGQEVMSIPIEDIKDVSNSFQNDPDSFGRKLALGIFASRKEEFLYVNTETPERAEVLVFKTKKNKSPEMMAKIWHNMRSPTHGTTTPADTAQRDSTVHS